MTTNGSDEEGSKALIDIDVDFSGLTKPATILVEKVSDAVGVAFEPRQVVRMARAEAEAAKIRAQSQLEITDLQRRGLERFVHEQTEQQENIESITRQAAEQVGEDAKPEGMERDWITNFFHHSQRVSDDEMQQLWAKVLAGEAQRPGSFAKRTVNLVASLDKKDAELFTKFCTFLWGIGTLTPLVYEPNGAIYMKHGINFDKLSHLDAIGLISFAPVAGYARTGFGKLGVLTYCGRPVVIEFPKESGNDLNTGHAQLTEAGEQLANIARTPGDSEFNDYVLDRWINKEKLVVWSPINAKPA